MASPMVSPMAFPMASHMTPTLTPRIGAYGLFEAIPAQLKWFEIGLPQTHNYKLNYTFTFVPSISIGKLLRL